MSLPRLIGLRSKNRQGDNCFPPSSPRPGLRAVCNRKDNTKIKCYKVFMIIFLISIVHIPFDYSGFYHLVGLHHAAVGEAAVVFIRIASPREV